MEGKKIDLPGRYFLGSIAASSSANCKLACSVKVRGQYHATLCLVRAHAQYCTAKNVTRCHKIKKGVKATALQSFEKEGAFSCVWIWFCATFDLKTLYFLSVLNSSLKIRQKGPQSFISVRLSLISC
jgi:hypothetical protein